MPVQADMLANDVQRMLRLAAEPVRPGELVTEQIRRAARRCSLTFSRARKLWYREGKVSALDFVSIATAVAQSNDALVAYQNAKAMLLHEQLATAKDRS